MSSIWRRKENQCPLCLDLGLWRMLNLLDWDMASWSWFRYGHRSFVHPCSKFWLSIFILKVQRTSMSFKSWFGALEDAGCFLLGLGIFILIEIWSLVFNKHMFQIWALYLDFEGSKNIHVLKALIWGFGGCWRFLTWIWLLLSALALISAQ